DDPEPRTRREGPQVQGDHRPEVAYPGHAGQSRERHLRARLQAELRDQKENTMRSRLSVVPVVIVSSLTALSASWAQMGGHRMIAASDLKWDDVPSLPPGPKIAVIERVTVLSGTFHMGAGDRLDSQKTMPLKQGDMMIMQPQTNHFSWTKEEVVVQLNGMGPWGVTYVNPADDPRKK